MNLIEWIITTICKLVLTLMLYPIIDSHIGGKCK